MPEGVVAPGGDVSGFIYFERAVDRANHLTLVWTAHTPDGRVVTKLSVPYDVVSE